MIVRKITALFIIIAIACAIPYVVETADANPAAAGQIAGGLLLKELLKIPKFLKNKIFKKVKVKKTSKWPHLQRTVAGDIGFKNPHTIGRLGEHLTVLRVTAMGYKKIISKYDKIHGIDGVFVKKINGKITEILLVETKVDGGKMARGQMSEKWVNKQVKKMLKSRDKKIRETGRIIRDNLRDNPKIVKKQLWRHDLATGKTLVKSLNSEGMATSTLRTFKKSNFIRDQIITACKNARVGITCFNGQRYVPTHKRYPDTHSAIN